MNWQNVNSDPTWESIDNWYWRSWEVCIGIVAACIPAMRPGYRTVCAGIASYFSRRSSQATNELDLFRKGNHSEVPIVAKPVASAEVGRAKSYGAGGEGFALKSLPGDKKTMDQGIQMTTRIDIEGTSGHESQRSLDLGHMGRGYGNRDFV